MCGVSKCCVIWDEARRCVCSLAEHRSWYCGHWLMEKSRMVESVEVALWFRVFVCKSTSQFHCSFVSIRPLCKISRFFLHKLTIRKSADTFRNMHYRVLFLLGYIFCHSISPPNVFCFSKLGISGRSLAWMQKHVTCPKFDNPRHRLSTAITKASF